MTIFDFIQKPTKYPDFRRMSQEDVVQLIGSELGIVFVWDKHLEEWICKQKKPKRSIEIDFSTYMTCDENDGKQFIGIGMNYQNGGWGSPCDSIDEAIETFKKRLQESRCYT